LNLSRGKIAVTGGSGGVGHFVIRNLLEHGYEIVNLDRVPPSGDTAPFVKTELTDYGATASAMQGCDGVVHLGANPHLDYSFEESADRFHNNTLSTFNVFNAAAANRMTRVVWASSETVYGFPFEKVRPRYLPVDEDHPLQPQSGYALSKILSEELARRMNTLYGVTFIGLRFSNILYTGMTQPANYGRVPDYWKDINSRNQNLWSYLDAEDAAESIRLSLTADIVTTEVFTIAAADTIMVQSNRELVEAAFPGTPITEGTGDHDSMLSIAKARKVLGYSPRYSWRDRLKID
jgi:nucleoside-diphosphate-sugar epimerase